MPVLDLPALAALLAPRDVVLGFDVGTKTIGLAVGTAETRIASALGTIRRRRWAEDAAEIERIVAERRVAAFVVGLPYNMDGSEGPRAQSVRQFAANLLARIDRPLAFQDERLSTHAVESFLVEEANLSRRRRARVVDKLAAAHILQGALDAMARARA